jgi:hypothetical protein
MEFKSTTGYTLDESGSPVFSSSNQSLSKKQGTVFFIDSTNMDPADGEKVMDFYNKNGSTIVTDTDFLTDLSKSTSFVVKIADGSKKSIEYYLGEGMVLLNKARIVAPNAIEASIYVWSSLRKTITTIITKIEDFNETSSKEFFTPQVSSPSKISIKPVEQCVDKTKNSSAIISKQEVSKERKTSKPASSSSPSKTQNIEKMVFSGNNTGLFAELKEADSQKPDPDMIGIKIDDIRRPVKGNKAAAGILKTAVKNPKSSYIVRLENTADGNFYEAYCSTTKFDSVKDNLIREFGLKFTGSDSVTKEIAPRKTAEKKTSSPSSSSSSSKPTLQSKAKVQYKKPSKPLVVPVDEDEDDIEDDEEESSAEDEEDIEDDEEDSSTEDEDDDIEDDEEDEDDESEEGI